MATANSPNENKNMVCSPTIGMSLLGGVLNSQIANDAQSGLRQDPDLARVLTQNIQDVLRNPNGISQKVYNVLKTSNLPI